MGTHKMNRIAQRLWGYTGLTIVLISVIGMAVSCQFGSNTCKKKDRTHAVNSKVVHPKWAENAVIYEVNIRQNTPEGTFKAFSEQLPRIKKLGVDILWIMPVSPIGETMRKGKLGSYYAIKDYLKINPEFGTMDDFKDLVAKAHALNMYVILDWVGDHTSWDNSLVKDHPDWYRKDSTGKMISPLDWTDVAQLNYLNPQLRGYMTDALKYWLKETNLDGFRCDVAGMVPCNFWDSARTELEKIKPVFMLAEDEATNCLIEQAFDMNYAWGLLHVMNEIGKGKEDAIDLEKYFNRQDSLYNPSIYRMNFLTNHDENTWSGSEFERLGKNVNAFALLTFTVPGMPLIYNGQEIGMNKRLRFFDKDTIPWHESEWFETYQKFIGLKKGHKIFWNGTAGGSFNIIKIIDNPNIFAFYREDKEERGLVILNFSDQPAVIKISDYGARGRYINYFTSLAVNTKKALNIPANGYMVLLKEL